ncbi:MAG: hypothetical protein LBE13_19015 [Bacteroidales bacterium]|jgi:hypothetical protein|nr:hypothetical protein [Bacteroidales bacterium]
MRTDREKNPFSEFIQPTTTKAIPVEKEKENQQDITQKFANNLEQHLVNLKNRQVILTSHFPFVLMSTADTVVFVLAKNKPITENLFYYTYSAVMKGLWNVRLISMNVENTVEKIAKIVSSKQKDLLFRLRELTDKIKEYEDALDNELKTFYLLELAMQEKG